MEGAVVLPFVPAALLAAGGTTLVVWGARTPSPPPRSVAVLRMIAGAGMLGAAVVALGGLYRDTPYDIIAYPILGVIVGVVWIVPWIAAAGIISARARQRRTRH